MKRDGALESLWQHNIPVYESNNQPVPSEQVYDVLIVGGGITGCSTAYLLQKAGVKCILAEAQNLGFGTTGGTTAHINTILDHPYNEIQKNFGEKDAQLLATACREMMQQIKNNITELNIDCEFVELPGYLFSQDEKQANELEKIHASTNEVGFEMKFLDNIPVPIPFDTAVEFSNQAQFHPVKYIYGLAKGFENAGGVILQNCRVGDIERHDDIIEAKTTTSVIRARKLIYATHIPPGVNILHFRCAPYRSYALAVTLKDENYPEGLAYDMYDPYHYYRTQEVDGKKYLIAGGEDHKTAHEENTDQCFRKLEAYVRKFYDIDEVVYKWSSQFFESTDGLPYIGDLPGWPANVYVATGFGGNGMTNGTIASMVLRDLIVDGDSKYKALFNPHRVKPIAGFTNFVKEQADVVSNMVSGFFSAEKIAELDELARGEAKVIKYEGRKIAMYKDENGSLHAINPVCPHAKCTVNWNMAEKSWDCPCHGSRFDADGQLLTGPARSNLEAINVQDLVER